MLNKIAQNFRVDRNCCVFVGPALLAKGEAERLEIDRGKLGGKTVEGSGAMVFAPT